MGQSRGGPVSVAAVVGEYLGTVPGSTRGRHRYAIQAWVTWCEGAGVRVLAARPADLVRYLDELTGTGMAPSTVASRLGVLRALYRYAHAAGHVRLDPSVPVRAPRVVRVSRGTWLTSEEVHGLLVAADRDPDPAVPALVWMLAIQGVRLAEPVGLDVADVRMERGRVVASVARKGTGGARADLLLAEPVGVRVLAAIAGRTTGPVLLHHTGGRLPLHTARHVVTATAALAGITVPVTPHALRRSFVTLGRDAGISDRDLQASTGHRGTDMLGYYDRARDGITRDAGDQFAASLGIEDQGLPAPIGGPPRPAWPGPLTGAQLRALQHVRGRRDRQARADRVEAVTGLIAQGCTTVQIAEHLGMAPARVWAIIRNHDLREPASERLRRREQVRALAAEGLASTAIGREVQMTPEGVLRLIHEYAMYWPRPQAPTAAARSQRRTRALELLAQGAGPHEIAADLAVTLGTVSRYLAGTGVRTNRPWTPEETAIALDPHLTAAQAALRLGRSTGAVNHERAKHRRVS